MTVFKAGLRDQFLGLLGIDRRRQVGKADGFLVEKRSNTKVRSESLNRIGSIIDVLQKCEEKKW